MVQCSNSEVSQPHQHLSESASDRSTTGSDLLNRKGRSSRPLHARRPQPHHLSKRRLGTTAPSGSVEDSVRRQELTGGRLT